MVEKKLKSEVTNHVLNTAISISTLTLLQKDVAEIKTALLGNEYNPGGGLLCRTQDLENELEKLKSRYNRTVYTISGILISVTVVFNLLMIIIDKVVK